MPEFHETGYGRRFFDAQLPELIKKLEGLHWLGNSIDHLTQAINELRAQLVKPEVGVVDEEWFCDGCGHQDNRGEACDHCGSLRKDSLTPEAEERWASRPTSRPRKKKKKTPKATKAKDRALLGRSEDVHALLAPRCEDLKQECFWVIAIDIRNRMLGVVEVARGSLAEVEVHPREVFRPAIELAAAGVILVHNHPSGDPTPSEPDIELTRRLRECGSLLGVPVIDHVVIGDEGYRSIAEMMGSAL